MKLALVISLLTVACCCVQKYHELEEWVLQNRDNLDNLTAGFFPANLQPSQIVEIFYHVNGTSWDYETYLPRPAPKGCAAFTQAPSTGCRTDLNLCGAYNNSNPSCVHLFRWYLSPIYLFVEPRLLSDMALNYLPGTAPMIQQVHLVIPEICDNTTTFVDKESLIWDQGVLLLNKLTPFLRGYAVSREPSIETENQGYATFCDANADDPGQVVVEHEKLYVESFIATAISLVALVFFTFLAAPILIYQRYDKIYTYAKQKSGNLQNHYLIWSIVTLCTAADYILGFLGLAYHYLCWSVPHFVISPTVDMFYLLVIVGCVVIALLNLPIAITVVLKSKKNDFPVPDLIRYITCHCRCCPCAGKENIKNYLVQILAVFHVLIALQISCVHTVFVFLAFIARPLPTAMTIIFYAATMFCLATTIMLLYASCDFKQEKRNFKESFTLTCSGIIQTFVFICFLFALIFFGITFLRITVFVGDTESGRISSMVGSLLPTLLIAIFGFGAKELLIDDKTKEEGDHDNDKVQDQNQNIES